MATATEARPVWVETHRQSVQGEDVGASALVAYDNTHLRLVRLTGELHGWQPGDVIAVHRSQVHRYGGRGPVS